MFVQECGGVKVVSTLLINGNTMVMEIVFILTNVSLLKCHLVFPYVLYVFWYYNLLLYKKIGHLGH